MDTESSKKHPLDWCTRSVRLERQHLAMFRWVLEASDGLASWRARRAEPGWILVHVSYCAEFQEQVAELLRDLQGEFAHECAQRKT